VLAAHADFSIDRVADTQVLMDALVAGIERSSSTHAIELNVSAAPRRL